MTPRRLFYICIITYSHIAQSAMRVVDNNMLLLYDTSESTKSFARASIISQRKPEKINHENGQSPALSVKAHTPPVTPPIIVAGITEVAYFLNRLCFFI